MPRVDTDEVTVLGAFVSLILTALPQLNSTTCFQTLLPQAAPIPPSGNYWITVSGSDSVFDEEMQDDGGDSQVMEDEEIIVTIFTRIRLDKVGYDASLLADATRGVKVIKKSILNALVNKDPTDGGGNTFLRDTIKVVRAGRPDHDANKGVAWMSITFRAKWDWNLS
jgi:hypothetical protein